MDYKVKILATDQQATGVGNGADVGDNDFVAIGGGGIGGKLSLESTGAMVVKIQVLDGQTRTITLYTVTFTEADTQTLDLDGMPYSHIRVNVDTYTDGALWATYQSY